MTVDNPYWDEVQPYLATDPWCGRKVIDTYGMYSQPRFEGFADRALMRERLVGQYAWTVTDPDTVEFVAAHAGSNIVDPLAGSGYWAHVLRQHGASVAAYDLNPPSAGGNHWHKAGIEHVPVKQGDGPAVASAYPHRSLLLAWPPYDQPTGADILSAFAGQRVIYIGEGDGGCCGDDAMFTAFRTGWREVAERVPVQWDGIHDFVTVYDRI